MKNTAIRADFLAADYAIRLPAPNGDPRGWRYWIRICATAGGRWVARVQQQITGMESPASVGEFPIAEISDTTAIAVARDLASQTDTPPVARRGRQFAEKSELVRSEWVVTLDGVDSQWQPRLVDVVIELGSMQEGLNQRREPCTAKVRRKSDFGDGEWYLVPCDGMNPQHAGAAAVSACRWIRWD